MNTRFSHNLKKLFFLMKNNFDKNLNKYDLTSSQLEVLFCLYHSSKVLNQRDIERDLNLTNPTINGLLSRLETKDFIKRDKDIKDCRSNVIKLTNKSKEIITIIINSKDKFENKLFAGITEEEINNVNNFMKKLICNLEGE